MLSRSFHFDACFGVTAQTSPSKGKPWGPGLRSHHHLLVLVTLGVPIGWVTDFPNYLLNVGKVPCWLFWRFCIYSNLYMLVG